MEELSNIEHNDHVEPPEPMPSLESESKGLDASGRIYKSEGIVANAPNDLKNSVLDKHAKDNTQKRDFTTLAIHSNLMGAQNENINPAFKKTKFGELDAVDKENNKFNVPSVEAFQQSLHIETCISIGASLTGPDPLTLDHLEQHYNTLFVGPLADLSRQSAENSKSTCGLIKSLYECVKKIPKYTVNELVIKSTQEDSQLQKSAEHISRVISLPLDSLHKKWLLKVVPEEAKRGATSLSKQEKFQRELVAHLVNVHGRFPIPLTVLIKYADVNGREVHVSAHEYVSGKFGLMSMERESLDSDEEDFEIEEAESEDSYWPIERDSAHNLLIFDLLFLNGDRHDNNLIFVPKGGRNSEHKVVGIDHGDSMLYNPRDAIKIDYLEVDNVFKESLDPGVFEVVSEDYQAQYAQIMRTQGIQEPAIAWMEFASSVLRTLGIKREKLELTARETAVLLMALHASPIRDPKLIDAIFDAISAQRSGSELDRNALDEIINIFRR